MHNLSRRLAPADRLRYSRAFLRVYAKLYPTTIPLLNKLIRAISQRRAKIRVLLPTLRSVMGRDTLMRCEQICDDLMTQCLLRTRTLAPTNLSVVCHCCLSFRAQLACHGCGKLHVCSGCMDFLCMQCAESED